MENKTYDFDKLITNYNNNIKGLKHYKTKFLEYFDYEIPTEFIDDKSSLIECKMQAHKACNLMLLEAVNFYDSDVIFEISKHFYLTNQTDYQKQYDYLYDVYSEFSKSLPKRKGNCTKEDVIFLYYACSNIILKYYQFFKKNNSITGIKCADIFLNIFNNLIYENELNYNNNPESKILKTGYIKNSESLKRFYKYQKEYEYCDDDYNSIYCEYYSYSYIKYEYQILKMVGDLEDKRIKLLKCVIDLSNCCLIDVNNTINKHQFMSLLNYFVYKNYKYFYKQIKSNFVFLLRNYDISNNPTLENFIYLLNVIANEILKLHNEKKLQNPKASAFCDLIYCYEFMKYFDLILENSEYESSF